jgi:hypothetical protein
MGVHSIKTQTIIIMKAMHATRVITLGDDKYLTRREKPPSIKHENGMRKSANLNSLATTNPTGIKSFVSGHAIWVAEYTMGIM